MTDFSDTIRLLPSMSHEETAATAIVMPAEMGEELHRRQEAIGSASNRILCLPLDRGEVMVRAAIVRAGMIGDPAWAALWNDFIGWLEGNPAIVAQVRLIPIEEVAPRIADNEEE